MTTGAVRPSTFAGLVLIACLLTCRVVGQAGRASGASSRIELAAPSLSSLEVDLAPTKPTLPRAATTGCGGVFVPVLKPKQFLLACATGNDQLIDARWSTWTASTAVAMVVNYYNSCSPSCAASPTWISTQAEAKLSFVVPTQSGRLFRTLSWRDELSDSCTSNGCVVKWQPWNSVILEVSAAFHAVGTSCPSSAAGLAADGYGFLVWCEAVGKSHDWVRRSVV